MELSWLSIGSILKKIWSWFFRSRPKVSQSTSGNQSPNIFIGNNSPVTIIILGGEIEELPTVNYPQLKEPQNNITDADDAQSPS